MNSMVAQRSAFMDGRRFYRFQDKKMNSMVAQRSAFMDGRCFYRFQDKDKPNLLITGKRPVRVSVVSSSPKAHKSIKVGILGASGHTGGQLVGLIANHPFFDISLLTADREAGQSIGSVFPHLNMHDLPDFVAVNDADFSSVDAVFCCLPCGTSQEIIKCLPRRLKIVDLSGGFTLRDVNDYFKEHGQPHRAPELQKEAVYGLTELHRKKIQSARLVANPGCYPTAILLALVPLVKANLIQLGRTSINSDDGLIETVHEVYQELFDVANLRVPLNVVYWQGTDDFMQVFITSYMAPGASIDDLRQHLKGFYGKEEFIKVLPDDDCPQPADVHGSNSLHMTLIPGCSVRATLIVVIIDKNLKGAAGQALQNLNLMMGIPENTGLSCTPVPLHPL